MGAIVARYGTDADPGLTEVSARARSRIVTLGQIGANLSPGEG